MQRDFVDDCRIRIISDVSDDVRECFRYFGRKIYIIHENLIDIHQCLFSKIMQVDTLVVDIVDFFENRLCVSFLYKCEEVFDQNF